jgi:hypothetical protein
MASRWCLSDQANDKLLLRLLHVRAVQPLYTFTGEGQGGALEVTSVAVLVAGCWPPDSEQWAALVAWAAAKFDVARERVRLDEYIGSDAGGGG